MLILYMLYTWDVQRAFHKQERILKVAGFEKINLPGVKRILAVGSGKGGVGKSTVAFVLSQLLAAKGLRVGLLDADLHGPSLPSLTGVAAPHTTTPEKKILPHMIHGIACVSMGFLVPEAGAVVWRGPMVQSALRQLLGEVAWGELDCLIVDMPPGTSDIHLTLAQRTHLDGTVLVSTPQELALADVRRALDFFEKINTPVVGLVENMATFACSGCGKETPLFGDSLVEKEALSRGLPFLGALPLDPALCQGPSRLLPFLKNEALSPATREGYARVVNAVESWLGEGKRP